MHRRPDDLRRPVARELHDVLGQIGLEALEAGGVQRVRIDSVAMSAAVPRSKVAFVSKVSCRAPCRITLGVALAWLVVSAVVTPRKTW